MVNRLILFTAVFFIAACGASTAPKTVSVEWQSLTEAGKTIPADHHVVITFGASWCVPCKKEIPAWDHLAGLLKEAPLTFVVVNLDSDRSDGEAFLNGLDVQNMAIIFDPKHQLVETFQPPAMPTTYMLSPQCEILFTHKGYYKGDEKKLLEKVREVLRTAD